ncbi:MAG: gephyrin-like molybdotransferase Glp, partial [Pseudomonadota bacterium]|nr:gephyrin-like molybdotransferase Glp [Pseudomonadota bacterium]
MTTTNDCCETPKAQPLLTMEEALDLLLAHARPIADTERVPTMDGLGRVLAEPVCSTIDVPGWDNSAMDGYAVRAADIGAQQGRLRIAQRIPAGISGRALEPGTAARIFTGAPVPEGTDTVVIQEVCERDGDYVLIPEDVEPGANIRRAGEDIAAGSEIIAAGTRLAPQHLGLAASVGTAELRVHRRLRVAVFSSGDELVMPGEPLGPGKIYNSNRFTLCGLLQALGCEIVDLGVVEDSLDATTDALSRAAEQSDLVMASGGVSVGEEDHVKPAVERLGSLDLWKIAIRPGKPLAFGHIGAAKTPFIGSPGNPVSLFVTFCLFARPFILRAQGITGAVEPRTLTARAGFDVLRANKRRDFQRARLEPTADGELVVTVYPSRSSGVLSSVAWANGLV